jgi:xanthine dehydrogenase YagT iron-sulfur-binding subunit
LSHIRPGRRPHLPGRNSSQHPQTHYGNGTMTHPASTFPSPSTDSIERDGGRLAALFRPPSSNVQGERQADQISEASEAADAGDAADAADAPSVHATSLRINGEPVLLELESWVTLLDMLRDRLQLTGTKKGCDHGQCGACTVLIDGKRVLSCLTLAVMHQGREIMTIEGMADGDALHPLQQAFVQHDALQCGYCTPGQICSAAGLINEGQARTIDDVRELMSGNICRCGAYPQITQAVAEVALGAARLGGTRTNRAPIIIGTVPA